MTLLLLSSCTYTSKTLKMKKLHLNLISQLVYYYLMANKKRDSEGGKKEKPTVFGGLSYLEGG